jgi:sodium transport system permease protein
MLRDRGETPTVGKALLFGVLILVVRFFANFLAPAQNSIATFAGTTLAMQIGLIAAPAILLSLALTRNPRKTLSLYLPRWQMVGVAVLLALLLHPVAIWLSQGIKQLYPVSSKIAEQMAEVSRVLQTQPLIIVVLLMAVTPAICEELAFRGFMLSGMRHSGHRWAAIAITSVFFGVTHGMLQQSLSAIVLGMVIGYIAVRSGSIFPGMAFHVTYNSLLLVGPLAWAVWLERAPRLAPLVHLSDTEYSYHPAIVTLCGLLAAALLYWFSRQPYQSFAEERLQHALDHQSPLTSPSKPQWRLW